MRRDQSQRMLQAVEFHRKKATLIQVFFIVCVMELNVTDTQNLKSFFSSTFWIFFLEMFAPPPPRINFQTDCWTRALKKNSAVSELPSRLVSPPEYVRINDRYTTMTANIDGRITQQIANTAQVHVHYAARSRPGFTPALKSPLNYPILFPGRALHASSLICSANTFPKDSCRKCDTHWVEKSKIQINARKTKDPACTVSETQPAQQQSTNRNIGAGSNNFTMSSFKYMQNIQKLL